MNKLCSWLYCIAKQPLRAVIFLTAGEHTGFQSKLNLRENSKTENEPETFMTTEHEFSVTQNSPSKMAFAPAEMDL